MTVRNVVDLLDERQEVSIVSSEGNVLESELAGYLTADYLECEVDVISSRVENIGKVYVSYIEIKVKEVENV